MNKAFFVIGFLILAVMAAIVVVPSFIDWSSYRGTFEREASRVVGREVRVGGDVQLRVFPSPYLEFQNLRVASSDGRFVSPFLRADRFKLMLEVPPLLRGTFKARRVELDGARLQLTVDKDGQGTWTSFEIAQSGLIPKDIVLPDVRIINGAVGLRVDHANQGMREIVFDSIDGNFSAQSSQGPFKFSGTIGSEREQKTLRFSTSRVERSDRDRLLELIAAIGDPARRAMYRLKGKIGQSINAPEFNGELEASVDLADDAQSSEDVGDVSTSLEIKSRLSITTSGLQIGDLVAGFETSGRPQVVTGDAVVSWRENVSVVGDFSAAWLDLNRFDSKKRRTGLSLIEKLQSSVDWLTRAAPTDGRVQISGQLKQASYRGGTLSNLRFGVARDRQDGQAGALRVKTLEVNLPGASRLAVSGMLKTGQRGGFDGTVLLRGGSLKRFSDWAMAGYGTPGGGQVGDRSQVSDSALSQDGFFAIRSKLRTSARDLQLSDFDAELLGTRVRGDLYRAFGEGSEAEAFNLTLNSAQFDLGRSGLVSFSPDRLLESLGNRKPEGTPAGELARWVSSHKRSNVDIQIGHLLSPEGGHRDVRLRFGVADDVLYLAEAHTISEAGYELSARGNINKVTTTPSGNLEVRVMTDTTDAIDKLAQTWISTIGFDRARLDARTFISGFDGPLRLVGSVNFEGDASRVTSMLSGTLGQADLLLNVEAREIKRQNEEKSTHLRADLQLSDPDGKRLWRGLAGASLGMSEAHDGAQPIPVRPGQFILSLDGSAADRMSFTSKFTSSDVSFDGDGEFRIRDGKTVLRSTVALGSQDVERVLGVGLARALVPPVKVGTVSKTTPLRLLGRLNFDDETWKLSDLRGGIGAYPVKGNISIGTEKTGSTVVVDGELELGWLGLENAMSALLLAGPIEKDEAAPIPVSKDKDGAIATVWSEQPFDLAWLQNMRGGVRVTASDASIGGSLSVQDFNSEVEFAPNRIALNNLKGRVALGMVNGKMTFDQKRAGVDMAMSLSVEDLSLRKALADLYGESTGAPRLNGKLNGTVSLQGRALGMRGLATVVSGDANVRLRDARIAELSPSFIQTAAISVLARRGKLQADQLKRELLQSLGSESLEIGDTRLAIKVADGVITVPPIIVQSKVSRAVGRTVISLDGLRLDSAWRMEPKTIATFGPDSQDGRSQPLGLDRKPLPPVSVVFSGPLTGPSKIEPQITYDGLLRELTVRRLEQDVGELERLRKREQEIAAELERRRKIQEERLAQERAEQIKQKALEEERRRRQAEQGRQAIEQLSGPQGGQTFNDGPIVPPRPVLVPEPLPSVAQ